ncbi:MAG: hypothetical protein VX527_09970, partial [Planctomycetota bacterium]|nr:hypothetical protein [Planctomycetota bacterium]
LISYYGACQVAPCVCFCTTEIDCLNQGYMFRGAGEPCPECPGIPKGPDCLTFDRGACCFDTECYPSINNPDFEYLTSADCELWGGVFRGSGTTCDEIYDGDGTVVPDQTICAPDPPLALGACCIPQTNLATDCLCGITTSEVCLSNHGIWQEYWDAPGLGANTHCFAQTCNGEYHLACFNDNATHEGACCLSTNLYPDGGCLVTDRVTCWALNGAFEGYQGDGIPCGEGLCDVGTELGACCIPSGNCIDRTEAECAAFPGDTTFYPDQVCIGSECPPDPADIFGACCLGPGGYCLDNRSQQDCLALQGDFQGDNSTCATTICIDGSQGACCVQINSGGETYYNCIQPYNQASCLSQGGTWLDDGQRCVDNPCGLKGVCCMEQVCYPDIDIDPAVLDSLECQAIGGTWTPGDVPCESGICVTRRGPPLRVGCDVNLDGVEDISDFLVIIQNYGQRSDRGDFNRDGIVTVDDILDYLAGCP